MPLRKELKRGLIALVLLASAGAVTFATVASTSTYRSSGKSANELASRLKHAAPTR